MSKPRLKSVVPKELQNGIGSSSSSCDCPTFSISKMRMLPILAEITQTAINSVKLDTIAYTPSLLVKERDY